MELPRTSRYMPTTTQTLSPPTSPERIWVTPVQLQRRWGINRKQLKVLRGIDTFPPELKLGPKTLRFRLDLIEEFEDAGGLALLHEAVATDDVLGAPRPTGPRNRRN